MDALAFAIDVERALRAGGALGQEHGLRLTVTVRVIARHGNAAAGVAGEHDLQHGPRVLQLRELAISDHGKGHVHKAQRLVLHQLADGILSGAAVILRLLADGHAEGDGGITHVGELLLGLGVQTAHHRVLRKVGGVRDLQLAADILAGDADGQHRVLVHDLELGGDGLTAVCYHRVVRAGEQLADVDENMFYRAINKAEPSLIRTEADELTYCLHIMVRYEIEKQLIGGTLAVKDVPAEWKRLYKKYLGVDVPSDREGCLQDSHWSGGSIGYFPSYALGSAYGAQMLHKMQEEIGDIWPDVAKGDLSKVTDWLRSHIHRYASFKKPGELFESVCGKFDAKYYTDYLTEKYTKLYGL